MLIDEQAQFWMNWIVQLLVALGTIAAVLAALFGKWFAGVVFPPRLHLSLHDPDGDKVPVNLSNGGQPVTLPSRWYHVRIENKQRLSPATQVNVNLVRIELPNASGEPVAHWTGEVPLKWRHQQIRQISPTVGQAIECDLFCLIRDRGLELQPMIVPNNMKHFFDGPCRLFVTLQATAVEGESNLIRLEIAWDGNWAEDRSEMRHHLVYRELLPASA